MLPTPDVVQRLPSGIEVVIEVMDTPRVVVEHHFRVGAAHEADDALGVAHLVEHVIFSPVGTEPAGEYDRFVEASGGTFRATTSIDRTVYRATVRPSDLAGLLQREARRFGPRVFAEAEVARELGVIAEERAWRIDGSTGFLRVLEEFGALLPNHPYGRAVAPPIDVLATLDRGRTQAFFDRWYRADRLQIVIAGPVDPAALLRTLPALYASLPGGAPPDPFPALPDWQAPGVIAGPSAAGLYWIGPGRGHEDHDALVWIDRMAEELDLRTFDRGALFYLPALGRDLDDLAHGIRGTPAAWITDARLEAAVEAARVALPVGSAEAWVDAWGTLPALATVEACRAAWGRWIAQAEPIHVRSDR